MKKFGQNALLALVFFSILFFGYRAGLLSLACSNCWSIGQHFTDTSPAPTQLIYLTALDAQFQSQASSLPVCATFQTVHASQDNAVTVTWLKVDNSTLKYYYTASSNPRYVYPISSPEPCNTATPSPSIVATPLPGATPVLTTASVATSTPSPSATAMPSSSVMLIVSGASLGVNYVWIALIALVAIIILSKVKLFGR